MAWLRDSVIATMPAPTYLVEDLLIDGTAVALVGAANVGKTFVALDLAFAVAGGSMWHGFEAQRGAVVYILAEGLGGLRQRVCAWRLDRKIADGVDVGVWFWDRAVQIASVADRQQFLMHLQEVPTRPKLIIVDTLARCFVGRDENAVQDMGRFVEGVDVLRESGATVLVLHHTGHESRDRNGKPIPATRERGSTALRGAVDSMLFLEAGPQRGDLVLRSSKQREGEPIDPLWLRLRQVLLPDHTSSCVVDDAPWSPGVQVQLPPRWVEALHALQEAGTLTSAQWLNASHLPKATYHRMRHTMLERGIVEQVGEHFMARQAPTEESHAQEETANDHSERTSGEGQGGS